MHRAGTRTQRNEKERTTEARVRETQIDFNEGKKLAYKGFCLWFKVVKICFIERGYLNEASKGIIYTSVLEEGLEKVESTCVSYGSN